MTAEECMRSSQSEEKEIIHENDVTTAITHLVLLAVKAKLN